MMVVGSVVRQQPSVVTGLIILAVLIVGNVCASSHPRCERIAAPMCQGLGYNTTHMPNFLDHTSQEEAILEMTKLDALFAAKCSPFLRLFVCSLYIPLCSDHVPGAVPACKGLCEEVSRDCKTALQAADFLQLNCSSFPEPPNLCMQQPPPDEELSVHNMEMQAKVETTKKCPSNTFRVGARCINVKTTFNRGNADDADGILVVQLSILICSVSSLIVIVFALLTFAVQPKRFRWPARPVLFLTISGLCTVLLYFAQWTINTLKSNDNDDEDSIVNKHHNDKWCIMMALAHTYFEFAFALWWCAFSYVWYLSASKEWSTEAIEKVAARIHSIVWSLSGVPIVHVLVNVNNVNTNKFTGFCQANSLTLTVTQCLIVAFGMFLAELAWRGLKSVRGILVDAGRSPYKLERLIYRLGIISFGISVPLLVAVLCYFSGSLYVELVKVCARFLSIIFSTLWVFSYKTFRSWNKILKPRFTHKGLRCIPVTKV